MTLPRTTKVSAGNAAGNGAPTPENEIRRLAALHQLGLRNVASDEGLNRIVRLAAAALQAPIALLSLVDEHREWWKSTHGWDGVREVPRQRSFGAYAIAADTHLLIVPDAGRDARFAAHPLVAGKDGIRFYAGHILTNSEGFKVGVLAVLDRQPRDVSPSQQQALVDLALLAEQELRRIPLRETLERLAEAERRAEEQHTRFVAFMENLPNVAFIKDSEGRTIFGNRYYEELFGVRLADMLGKRDDQWLPPEIAAETMAADHEVVTTGRSLRIEEEIPTVLGTRHWLTFKFPVPTPSGERLLGGIAVDITAQKQTERQLQELVSLQHALVNSANVAIISTGRNGLIRTFNAAAERLLGYTADEVVDRARPEIWHLPAELERIAEEIRRQSGEKVVPTTHVLRWGLRHGAVAEHELNLVRKDGSTFQASLAITALWIGEEITGYMAVIQDITARRELEEMQRRAREDAEEENRAKSQFVANMSHEIRTPLNGILGVTGMLLETDLGPRQRELAEFVLSSGKGLLAVVNDILDFSKVEAGRVVLESIDFDLAGLLQSVCELHRARAEEKSLTIRVEMADDVPSHLRGDPARLRQVLHNLVDNAVKFSGNGTIHICADLDGMDGDAVTVRFHVIDGGIGISEEQQTHIFDPFSQADASTTRLFGGTGLGLTISRQLVELMGGTIGVESRPGHGSDFSFSVRFAQPSPTAAEKELSPEPEPKPAFPSLRVLLAEDSAINRLVTTDQLQKLGCDVESVADGQQAVDLALSVKFDLIIMDCQMPILDGYTATNLIREREEQESQRTRIIAVTANAFAGERERCLAAGMDGYLAKPFNLEDLRKEIRRVMQLGAGSGLPICTPLDRQAVAALRRECGPEGEELFSRYIDFFREDLISTENALATAETEQRTEDLNRILHRLRGAAANFGAHPLIDCCARLEKCTIPDAPPSEAAALMTSLRKEITAVKNALTEIQPAKATRQERHG